MCMVWVLTWALCPPANNHSTVQSFSVNSLQFNMSTGYLGKQKRCQKSIKTCCMTLIRQHSHIRPPVLPSMSLPWISIIPAFNVVMIPLMAFLMESFNRPDRPANWFYNWLYKSGFRINILLLLFPIIENNHINPYSTCRIFKTHHMEN